MRPLLKFDKIVEKVFLAFCIFFAVLLVCVCISGRNSKKISLGIDKARDFSSGWYFTDLSGEMSPILKFPAKVPTFDGKSAKIYNTISNVSNGELCIDLYTHHQDLRVFLDGNPIYIFKSPGEKSRISSYRSLHHAVPIPLCKDGLLCVETTAVLPSSAGEFYPIRLGSREQIAVSVFFDRPGRLFMSLILLAFGAGLFLVSKFYIKIDNDKTLSHLTRIIIAIGIWQFEESRALQVFTGFQPLHWFCEYPLQLFVILNLFLLDRDISRDKSNYWLKSLFISVVVISTIQIVLQLTGIAQFTQTMFLTQLLYVFACVYLCVFINKDNNFSSSLLRALFIAASSCMSVSILLLFIFRGRTSITDWFLNTAIIFSFVTTTVIVYQKAIYRVENMKKTEIYRRLAFIDFATGVSSRTAWYRMTEEFDPKKTPMKNCCLVMFDMNNLKTINDKYGHLFGDKVIADFCSCLENAVGSKEGIFRLGGDEFIYFKPDSSEKEVIHLLERFEKNLADQPDGQIKFTAAYGHTIFTPDSSADFVTAENIADANMYENKRQKKAGRTSEN